MLGIIYKLYSDDMETIYIGSTFLNIKARFACHLSQNLGYIKNKYKKNSSKILKPSVFPLYCSDSGLKYQILREVECDNKSELIHMEYLYCEAYTKLLNKKLLNVYLPGRTQKQNYKDKRRQKLAYQKKYNLENKEYIKIYQKKYYLSKKEL